MLCVGEVVVVVLVVMLEEIIEFLWVVNIVFVLLVVFIGGDCVFVELLVCVEWVLWCGEFDDVVLVELV